MALTIMLLLVAAALIYGACEFFVNGVEWGGRKIGVSDNAVGTILAAFGTALPESVVTLVAVAAAGAMIIVNTVGYPLAGWVASEAGSTAAFAVLASVVVMASVAALKWWPAHDPLVLEHTHGDPA